MMPLADQILEATKYGCDLRFVQDKDVLHVIGTSHRNMSEAKVDLRWVLSNGFNTDVELSRAVRHVLERSYQPPSIGPQRAAPKSEAAIRAEGRQARYNLGDPRGFD